MATDDKQAGYSLVEVLVTSALTIGVAILAARMVYKSQQVSDPIVQASELMDVKYYITSNFSCAETLKKGSCPSSSGAIDTYRPDGMILTEKSGSSFDDFDIKAECISEENNSSLWNKFNFYYKTGFSGWTHLINSVPVICHNGSEQPPPDPGEEADPPDEVEVVVGPMPSEINCESDNLLQFSEVISFPETDDCDWGKNGNLSEEEGYLQAIKTQSQSVNLPPNAVICDLSLKSLTTDWHYDDFAILTLNNSVLVSSNRFISSKLSKQFGIYTWSWDTVKGIKIKGNFGAPSYCINGKCEIPEHDEEGKVEIEPVKETVYELSAKNYGQPLKFSLVTTGDDDTYPPHQEDMIDCKHTGLDLQLKVAYYTK